MKKNLLILLSILFFIGCKEQEKIENIENNKYCLDENNRGNVGIWTLNKEKVIQQIHLTGSIEANPDRVVHFVSLVDGIISKTYFSLGDVVEKDQVLAELKSTELSALQSELNRIINQIEIAKIDLSAQEQMFEDGISSNKEWIEAKSHLEILKAEKQRIESNLNLFSASPNKNAFLIKAPSAGIITTKNINSGSTVTNNGEILFSISDLKNVWAMANVYTTEIADIKTGMPIELKTLSYFNEKFEGKIDVVSQVLDDDARVLKARIVLENPEFKLKPGMLADITVLKESKTEAIAIPTSAIIFFDNKNYVLVHHDDCHIEKREIQLLTESNGKAYIENGLNENEKILTQNHLLIFEEIS